MTAAEPSSKSVDNAARRGWEVISANFLLPQWVRTHWETFRTACEETGRTADPQSWRVARTIFVADDEATAREYAFGPDSPYRFYYDQLGTKLIRAGRANLFKTDDAMPDEAVTSDYMVDRLVIAGTPDQVVDGLLELREIVGDFGTILYCGTDWVDPVLDTALDGAHGHRGPAVGERAARLSQRRGPCQPSRSPHRRGPSAPARSPPARPAAPAGGPGAAAGGGRRLRRGAGSVAGAGVRAVAVAACHRAAAVRPVVSVDVVDVTSTTGRVGTRWRTARSSWSGGWSASSSRPCAASQPTGLHGCGRRHVHQLGRGRGGGRWGRCRGGGRGGGRGRRGASGAGVACRRTRSTRR